jgi:hypothetical protein
MEGSAGGRRDGGTAMGVLNATELCAETQWGPRFLPSKEKKEERKGKGQGFSIGLKLPQPAR